MLVSRIQIRDQRGDSDSDASDFFSKYRRTETRKDLESNLMKRVIGFIQSIGG